MKRIFIAIDISEEARNKAALYIEGLRRAFPRLRVGWEKPEKLHLTLKFLGDVDDAVLSDVMAELEQASRAHGGFDITLEGTGKFPPKGDPRVLWIGVEEGGPLEHLAADIHDRIARLGFEREKRRFDPHLTIARLREPSKSRSLAAEHTESDFGPVRFPISEISIYESRLQPGGSVYTRVASSSLAGEKN